MYQIQIFAHLNTYDCDTFGESGQCLSLGGRYIICK